MGITNAPQIMFGDVMHARLSPKTNKFKYSIFYVCLPLPEMKTMALPYNRRAVISFYDCDHGACDGSSLENWARNILNNFNCDKVDGDITLVCMPRVLGYVFNPVSFWLCHDKDKQLRAVICEVHNTFGEKHSYLCVKPDQSIITEKEIITGQKMFHVSPFLEREGEYQFRFETRAGKFGVWIDYYNADGEAQLITSLRGDVFPLNQKTLRNAFWKYPLVTLKAIFLIHWQALKIISKGIGYISKPKQRIERVSATTKITKK